MRRYRSLQVFATPRVDFTAYITSEVIVDASQVGQHHAHDRQALRCPLLAREPDRTQRRAGTRTGQDLTLIPRSSDAGFVSGKRLLDAWHIAAAYRAITTSRVPLGRIARMLGCTTRAMAAQFVVMIGVTCSALRAEPISVEEVARRMARRLTERER